MKEPKNRFRTYDEFDVEERMGVPAGIIQLSEDSAKFVMKAIAEKNVLEDTDLFKRNYRVENSHPEFPVELISLTISNQLVPMNKEIVVEGSFNSSSLVIHEDGKIRFDIAVHLKIDLMFSISTKPEIILKRVLQEIESLFYHEFLHAYEDYKRSERSNFDRMYLSKDFLYALTSNLLSAQNPELSNELRKFLFLVYASASFEVRARIAQVYPFIKDITNQKDREKIIKSTDAWELAKDLKDFDASAFYETLLREAGDKNIILKVTKSLENAIKNVTVQKTGHFMQSIDASEISKEEVSRAKLKVEKNFSDIMKISGDDPEKFFSLWQKKFNSEGEKSIRKLSKMVSI